jgi:hypothetical protein
MEELVDIDLFCPQHRVKHVANRLAISVSSLTGLLRHLGFNVGQGKDSVLAQEHIRALANYYKTSFRKTAEKAKIKVRDEETDAFSYLKLFFNVLKVPSSGVLDLSDFESWEFDDEKIEEVFYRIIYSVRVRAGNGSKLFMSVIHRLISLTVTAKLDFRSILLSKISPTLFFRYQGEEEPDANADQYFGFSVVKYFFTLKAFVTKLIISAKSIFSYEKNTFETMYPGVQFI